MRPKDELLALAEDAVKRALARGADAVEAYVVQAETTRVSAAGAYASPSVDHSDGVAVRVVVRGRLGFAGAPSFSALDRCITDALAGAGTAGAAVGLPFAPPGGTPGPGRDVSPFLGDRADEAIALVERIVHHAQRSKVLTYVETVLRRSLREFAVANSSGVAVLDTVGAERVDLEVRASRGTTHRSAREAQVGSGSILETLRPEALVDEVEARAASALDHEGLPRPAETVLFRPAPGCQMLNAVSPAFSAIAAGTGKSPLSGKVGTSVYSPLLNLKDEPAGPAGVGSRRFDDEGTPMRDHALVQAGTLVDFLYDAHSAARAGRASTGHGIRQGVTGGVAPRAVHLVMEPGDRAFDEILAGVDRAVLVTEPFLGAFTSDQVTGDFSVVAPFAFLVEGGKVRHALPPTTVAGNAHAVLRTIRALSRERRSYAPATLPSMLAGGVTCAT